MATVNMFEPGMARLEDIAVRMAHYACEEIADDVILAVPVQHGNLLRSVRVEKLERSGRVWIGTDHWYFIEYGVKPHIIRVRYKMTLASKERVMFGKKVNHPGHRAYAPMRRSFYKRRMLSRFKA